MASRRLLRRTIGLLSVIFGLASPLAAQNPRPDNRAALSATLPESNEAMLLSGRADDAIQRGDFRLAIELIEQILKFSGELVVAPASRTYHPVWRQAMRLMEKFPLPGVQTYRQLHDAEVIARFQAAAAAADLETLRELFRVYRLSSAWPAVGRELAAQLLEKGFYGEAIGVLRELLAAEEIGSPELRLQLVAALANAGAGQSAWRLLTELEKTPPAVPPPHWAERVATVRQWLRDGAAKTEEAFIPRLDAQSVWSQPLLPNGPSDWSDQDSQLADAIAYLRRMPLYQAIVADGLLLVRLRGTVWAFDALALTPRWRGRDTEEPETKNPATPGPGRRFRVRRGQLEVEQNSPFSGETEQLFSHALSQALSAGFGKVYTVEGRKDALDPDDELARPWFRTYGPVFSNELVARDIATGQVAWRAGHETSDPLRGVAFQDAPIPLGAHLLVPVQRDQEIHVCVLDPATGKLVREAPVVGPPIYLTGTGGRCLLATDETTVYVCTGNGVVAALDRDDLSWKWATVYPSTLGERFGIVFWQAETQTHDSNMDRPVITDDLLIVAPMDSDHIFALDRFSGREQWRMERGAYTFLVGAVEAGLVVGGNVIACLDPADGRTVRWRSCPLEVTGRPTIRAQRVFVPTRRGLVVLDARNGKIVDDQSGGPVLSAAINLTATDDALFGVSPAGVVKFPDPRAARAACEARLARDAEDPWARLTLARLDMLAAAPAAALARLENWRPADAALAGARDRLLSDALIALARGTEQREEKLNWLRRAAALSISGEVRDSVNLMIGEALEKSGQWREAFRHYREFLLREDGGSVPAAGDAGLRVAGWLYAAERLRHCVAHLPSDEATAVWRELVETVPTKPEGPALWERLRLVVSDPAQRAKIDQTLSLMPLPPEIAIRYLPSEEDSRLPEGLRRRLYLQRWETHVALGMLEEAQADRRVWQEHFASTPPSSEAPTSQAITPAWEDTEQDRVRRITETLEKLEKNTEQAFTVQSVRQWGLSRDGDELIVDPRRPETAMRPVLLVRNLAKQQIKLCRTSNSDTLRDTPDGIAEATNFTGDALELMQQAGNRGPARITTWPVVLYEHLAAVPVSGGLVCVGLGPERAGGRRLWEYEVREWAEVPMDFSERAVAGPEGIYFAPRDDRVVLLGWSDGRPRWSRTLPDLRVQRLDLAGNRLVIIGEEQEIVTVDAVFGNRPQSWPLKQGTPRAVDVIAGMVVLWGDEQVAGLDPETLAPRWTRPYGTPSGRITLPERGWIAYRARHDPEWRLLDARTGEAVFAAPLKIPGDITAMAVQNDVLLAAALLPRLAAREGEPGRAVQIHAFDAADGRLLWSQTVATVVPLNRTQLLAHAELIPVLLANPTRSEVDPRDIPALAIQFVDKRTGQKQPEDPFQITNRFKRIDRQMTCGLYLLATPSRFIVQVAGNLAAFGNGSGP